MTSTTRRPRGNTTSKTGDSGNASTQSATVKSEDAAADADPRRAFYNSLMRLQGKAPVKAMMRKIPEARPLEIAMSSTRPELALLLTPSGFQLRQGRDLVGFFELPMFKAPRDGLEGFDGEAIHQVVMKRAQK